MRLFEEVLDLILENLDSKISKIRQMVFKDLERPRSSIKRLLKHLEYNNSDRTGQASAEEESNLIEYLAKFFNQFDPTKDRAEYTVWITKAYINSAWVLPDDGDTLSLMLTKFMKAKRMVAWSGERDINKYPDFDRLYVAVKDIELESDMPSSIRQWDQKVKSARSKYVTKAFQDSLFEMFIVKNDLSEKYDSINIAIGDDEYSTWVPESLAGPEIQKQKQSNPAMWTGRLISMAAYVAKSITKMSKNSWCTANPIMGERYLNNGPLHFVYKKTPGGLVPFLLANGDWTEIMDPGQTGRQLPLSNPQLSTLIFLVKIVEKGIVNPAAAKQIISRFYGNGIREQIKSILKWPDYVANLEDAKVSNDQGKILEAQKLLNRNKVAVDILLVLMKGRKLTISDIDQEVIRLIETYYPDALSEYY